MKTLHVILYLAVMIASWFILVMLTIDAMKKKEPAVKEPTVKTVKETVVCWSAFDVIVYENYLVSKESNTTYGQVSDGTHRIYKSEDCTHEKFFK